MKWFEYNQNNSGGYFVVNEDVSEFVFVQALSAREANEIAERFCDNSDSCECCGDRWYFSEYGEGTASPMIYGKPLTDYQSGWVKDFARLHYFDGRVEAYPPTAPQIAV